MVSSPSLGGSDGRGDRAQLILVGALAIAIVVLGLVVVFNSVLYTDNVAASGAVNEPNEAEELDREIQLNSKRLTERVNAKKKWGSQPDVYDALVRNLTAYRNGVTNVTGLSSGAVVSFAVDSSVTGTTYGARIRDEDGGDFTSTYSSPEPKNWSVMGSGDGVIIRDFDMVIDKAGLEGPNQDEAFHLIWEDPDTGDNHAVWIYRLGSGEVAIRTLNNSVSPSVNFAAGNECVLPGSDTESTFIFNFSDGSIAGYEGCSSYIGPWTTIPNGTVRNLEFVRADNVSGRYSMVVNAATPTGDVSQYLGGTAAPHWTPAVWEFDVLVSYETSATTYTNGYTIEVYNRSR